MPQLWITLDLLKTQLLQKRAKLVTKWREVYILSDKDIIHSFDPSIPKPWVHQL